MRKQTFPPIRKCQFIQCYPKEGVNDTLFETCTRLFPLINAIIEFVVARRTNILDGNVNVNESVARRSGSHNQHACHAIAESKYQT